MWRRFGSWIGRRTSMGAPSEPEDWSGGRSRSHKPTYDRALRRAPQDWPGADDQVPPQAPRLPLCRRWVYQLQALSWERIEASTADVAVVDMSPETGAKPFTPEQIEHMRTRPGGGLTAVLCYLSIGAAEPWRPYWDRRWRRTPPEWLTAQHGEWAGTALTHFWNARWQSFLFGSPGSMLDRIIDAGFDGVVLDGVDRFEHFRALGRRSAPDEMIELVARIGAHAWGRSPNFLVVPLNGEELLASPHYRSLISAQIREDILFRPDVSTNQESLVANNDKIVGGLMEDLGRALADDIPVLGIEYLCNGPTGEAMMPAAANRLRRLGIVPNFAPRRLDKLGPM